MAIVAKVSDVGPGPLVNLHKGHGMSGRRDFTQDAHMGHTVIT